MRYLLDTNILAHLVKRTHNEISYDVWELITDFSNQTYASTISILELLQLHRIGKINSKYETASQMITALQEDFYIEVLSFRENHTQMLAHLTIHKDHNDPFDHAIISHALADNLILVSSDRKFDEYTQQGLKFVYNER